MQKTQRTFSKEFKLSPVGFVKAKKPYWYLSLQIRSKRQGRK